MILSDKKLCQNRISENLIKGNHYRYKSLEDTNSKLNKDYNPTYSMSKEKLDYFNYLEDDSISKYVPELKRRWNIVNQLYKFK